MEGSYSHKIFLRFEFRETINPLTHTQAPTNILPLIFLNDVAQLPSDAVTPFTHNSTELFTHDIGGWVLGVHTLERARVANLPRDVNLVLIIFFSAVLRIAL